MVECYTLSQSTRRSNGCVLLDELQRNEEILFFSVVKQAFNQRRKTIRNSMKPILNPMPFDHEYLQRRPERMSVEDFIELTRMVESHLKK